VRGRFRYRAGCHLGCQPNPDPEPRRDKLKRGTPEHPKTTCLATFLGVNRITAVGILELLWHFTAKYAPRGDIGRFDNTHIAAGIHWEGDPDALVRALVQSKWVEIHSDPEIRLVIHDWEEHSDDYTRKRVKKSGLGFAGNGTPSVRDFLEKSGTGNTPNPEESRSSGAPSSALPCLAVPVPAPLVVAATAANSEYPKTITEIRKHDPAVDETFVRGLANKVSHTILSHPEFPQEEVERAVKDAVIAKACRESFATGPPGHRAGLLLSRVPNIIVSWGLEKET
jgi:hypothetical protein